MIEAVPLQAGFRLTQIKNSQQDCLLFNPNSYKSMHLNVLCKLLPGAGSLPNQNSVGRSGSSHSREPHHTINKTILKAMKLITILLFAACMQVSAGAFSQTVTLKEKDISLKEIFAKIEVQTGYTFICKSELLSDAKKVTINVTNAPLEEALAICFKEQLLSYKILDKIIDYHSSLRRR